MTTPSKYQYKTQDWEKKHWLYEQYWGEKKSVRLIASEVGKGKRTIAKQLESHGIPTRESSYTKDNTVSMFAGFYNEDEAARADSGDIIKPHVTKSVDYSTSLWQKQAKNDPAIGEAAKF